MIAANTRDLSLLTEQLVEHLMAAVLFANKIQEAMAAEHLMIGNADGPGAVAASIHQSVRIKERPILDSSTLTMMWKGKHLHLGHTLSFRLMAVLIRRSNRYVTHVDLAEEVWDTDDMSTATIRSQVRELRRKLRQCGMSDLATAIRGHNGRYILDLL